MSPELVNHQGYGKEIDVWSLGILLYEMIHGYSPFRPNKPKFNEKEVMENIKNHNLIFGKTVSDECKQLIYHLLDPDINKRYSVEDIYNSEFVKKYERIHYCYPDINLIQFYNKKNMNDDEQNLNLIDKNDENINFNNIKNVINSKLEINNSLNNNIIYLDNNNYENRDFRSLYNAYNDNQKNIINYDLNRGINFDNVKNEIFYEPNIIDKKYSNDINILFDNPKNEVNSLFNNNNQNQNISKNYLENNERHPKDNEKFNKEYSNYNNNNNSCLVFEGILKKSSMNLNNNNENYLNKIENKVLWNNSVNNNISQISNISNQYIQNNKNEINQNNIQKFPMTKNFENKSVNYNYYYNFNNYNNNFTNNFFNNNYSQISTNPFPKKISISNYNIDTENSNLNNSNINLILDKNKTPSTIPTSSQDNKNKSIVIKQKKISAFEIGEEKYNLSDKEQNENDHSDIKININHEHQKINNKKYLNSSDCSFLRNKEKEKRAKNIFIKKLDIGDIKIANTNKINNSERIKEPNNNNSDIENVEHYLLKNRIYKSKKENNYKIIANISEPNLKSNDIIYNNIIKAPNSKVTGKKKILRFLSERNIIERDEKEKNIKLNQENLVKKINKEKKEYNNILKNKNINGEHKQIIKKNDSGKSNFIGDLLCSIFNGFDSKKDQKNEINMLKDNNKHNNTHNALITKIQNQEKSNKTRNINYTKSNSFIKIEKNNQKLNKNSSFITINNKKNKIISLGLPNIENSIFGSNKDNKKIMINDIKTQPNIENKENNNNYNNILNNKEFLKHSISLNDAKYKINDKITTNSRNKIIEIPINSHNIDLIEKNKKNSNNNINLNNSKIITPKKKYIFNRIHPFKLLGAFKKELTNYSIQNSKFNIKK